MKRFRQLLLGAILVSSSLVYGAQEVRIASHVSALSPLHYQAEAFAKAAEAALPGKFEFKHYPNGQLGDEKALITNVKAGSLEMIIVASGGLKLDPKLDFFDLPWLFNDRAHVIRAMKAGLEDEVKKTIEEKTGLIVLGIYENGFRHIMNTKHAIFTPADMQGLKIRVAGGKVRQDTFREMGASPQKVAWTETFTALQTGVVDGAEAATYGFYEQKHHEIMNYFSITNHVYTPSFLLASKKFFDSLKPEEQATLKRIGHALTESSYKEAEALEKKYLDEMKSKTQINEANVKLFQEKLGSEQADYEKKFGNKWLNIVKSTAQ
ncbi:MAG: TRAP transporter substrate-binding protein [Sulfurospirillaceae bacterium]|nr:TRAP transporter substrate-binding protein [Sulfurospirillaceae bacterium]MDD2826129.1 TRAP transporter substrate-binding protein [Sulfurospirillaceae bacterium]